MSAVLNPGGTYDFLAETRADNLAELKVRLVDRLDDQFRGSVHPNNRRRLRNAIADIVENANQLSVQNLRTIERLVKEKAEAYKAPLAELVPNKGKDARRSSLTTLLSDRQRDKNAFTFTAGKENVVLDAKLLRSLKNETKEQFRRTSLSAGRTTHPSGPSLSTAERTRVDTTLQLNKTYAHPVAANDARIKEAMRAVMKAEVKAATSGRILRDAKKSFEQQELITKRALNRWTATPTTETERQYNTAVSAHRASRLHLQTAEHDHDFCTRELEAARHRLEQERKRGGLKKYENVDMPSVQQPSPRIAVSETYVTTPRGDEVGFGEHFASIPNSVRMEKFGKQKGKRTNFFAKPFDVDEEERQFQRSKSNGKRVAIQKPPVYGYNDKGSVMDESEFEQMQSQSVDPKSRHAYAQEVYYPTPRVVYEEGKQYDDTIETQERLLGRINDELNDQRRGRADAYGEMTQQQYSPSEMEAHGVPEPVSFREEPLRPADAMDRGLTPQDNQSVASDAQTFVPEGRLTGAGAIAPPFPPQRSRSASLIPNNVFPTLPCDNELLAREDRKRKNADAIYAATVKRVQNLAQETEKKEQERMQQILSRARSTTPLGTTTRGLHTAAISGVPFHALRQEDSTAATPTRYDRRSRSVGSLNVPASALGAFSSAALDSESNEYIASSTANGRGIQRSLSARSQRGMKGFYEPVAPSLRPAPPEISILAHSIGFSPRSVTDIHPIHSRIWETVNDDVGSRHLPRVQRSKVIQAMLREATGQSEPAATAAAPLSMPAVPPPSAVYHQQPVRAATPPAQSHFAGTRPQPDSPARHVAHPSTSSQAPSRSTSAPGVLNTSVASIASVTQIPPSIPKYLEDDPSTVHVPRIDASLLPPAGLPPQRRNPLTAENVLPYDADLAQREKEQERAREIERGERKREIHASLRPRSSSAGPGIYSTTSPWETTGSAFSTPGRRGQASVHVAEALDFSGVLASRPVVTSAKRRLLESKLEREAELQQQLEFEAQCIREEDTRRRELMAQHKHEELARMEEHNAEADHRREENRRQKLLQESAVYEQMHNVPSRASTPSRSAVHPESTASRIFPPAPEPTTLPRDFSLPKVHRTDLTGRWGVFQSPVAPTPSREAHRMRYERADEDASAHWQQDYSIHDREYPRGGGYENPHEEENGAYRGQFSATAPRDAPREVFNYTTEYETEFGSKFPVDIHGNAMYAQLTPNPTLHAHQSTVNKENFGAKIDIAPAALMHTPGRGRFYTPDRIDPAALPPAGQRDRAVSVGGETPRRAKRAVTPGYSAQVGQTYGTDPALLHMQRAEAVANGMSFVGSPKQAGVHGEGEAGVQLPETPGTPGILKRPGNRVQGVYVSPYAQKRKQPPTYDEKRYQALALSTLRQPGQYNDSIEMYDAYGRPILYAPYKIDTAAPFEGTTETESAYNKAYIPREAYAPASRSATVPPPPGGSMESPESTSSGSIQEFDGMLQSRGIVQPSFPASRASRASGPSHTRPQTAALTRSRGTSVDSGASVNATVTPRIRPLPPRPSSASSVSSASRPSSAAGGVRSPVSNSALHSEEPAVHEPIASRAEHEPVSTMQYEFPSFDESRPQSPSESNASYNLGMQSPTMQDYQQPRIVYASPKQEYNSRYVSTLKGNGRMSVSQTSDAGTSAKIATPQQKKRTFPALLSKSRTHTVLARELQEQEDRRKHQLRMKESGVVRAPSTPSAGGSILPLSPLLPQRAPIVSVVRDTGKHYETQSYLGPEASSAAATPSTEGKRRLSVTWKEDALSKNKSPAKSESSMHRAQKLSNTMLKKPTATMNATRRFDSTQFSATGGFGNSGASLQGVWKHLEPPAEAIDISGKVSKTTRPFSPNVSSYREADDPLAATHGSLRRGFILPAAKNVSGMR